METARAQEQIHPSWHKYVLPEFEKPYMENLRDFLKTELTEGHRFYPPSSQTLNALMFTPLDNIKCLIMGQDPYHGPGQAMGLSFSVPKGIPIPPSLRNIYKELSTDIGLSGPSHGDLTRWAEEEGILLLNSSLSVRPGIAGSHAGKGWEDFTNHIVGVASEHAPPFCAILWGAHAQRKEELIDTGRHKIIKSPHPSPLSASRGFFHSKPFSQCNAWLESKQRGAINWTP